MPVNPIIASLGSLIVITLFFASLYVNRVVVCDMEIGETIYTVDAVFGQTAYGGSVKSMDSFSHPTSVMSFSYEGGQSIFQQGNSTPSLPGSLPTFAKTSFYCEIAAAYLVLFTLIMHLSGMPNHIPMRITALLATANALVSAVMNTIMLGPAGSFSQDEWKLSNNTPTNCSSAIGSYFAWAGFGLWTLLLLHAIREMRAK